MSRHRFARLPIELAALYLLPLIRQQLPRQYHVAFLPPQFSSSTSPKIWEFIGGKDAFSLRSPSSIKQPSSVELHQHPRFSPRLVALIASYLGIVMSNAILVTYCRQRKYYTVRSLTGWAEMVLSRLFSQIGYFVSPPSLGLCGSASSISPLLFHCGNIIQFGYAR